MHYEKFADGSVKCIEDEIPFELPEGWAWTRISTVAFFMGGYAYKSSKYISDSQNILIRIGNIKNNSINPLIAKTCISDEYAAETDSYLIRENDILFTMTGTRGKRDYFYSCRIEKSDLEGLQLFLNQRVGCLRLVSTADILPSYFVNTIQSSYVLDAIFATETGNVNQGNIGSTATLNLLIPVAPTEEQYKIQEKSLSILSAIEQYDIDTEDLSKIINKLRIKILDLAICGQLVPQDPADEPASVLLERIRAEKEELIKQGKIKRNKKESIIFKGDDNSYYEKVGTEIRCIDNEIPFEIPDSWAFVRLKHIGTVVGGGTPKTNTPSYWDGEIPWLTPADLSGYTAMYISSGGRKITKDGLKTSSAQLMPQGTVLYSSRAPIGYVAISANPITTNQGFKSVVPYNFSMSEYLYYCLKTRTPDIEQRATGTTFKEISGSAMAETIVPLPPLAEQQRIVDSLHTAISKFCILEEQLN